MFCGLGASRPVRDQGRINVSCITSSRGIRNSAVLVDSDQNPSSGYVNDGSLNDYECIYSFKKVFLSQIMGVVLLFGGKKTCSLFFFFFLLPASNNNRPNVLTIN